MGGGGIGVRGEVMTGAKVKVMQGGAVNPARGRPLEGGKGTQPQQPISDFRPLEL